jgi:hypothetical protein
MEMHLKNVKTGVMYGFFIWLIPFAISFLLFPLYQSDRQFFESIMSVTLVSVTVYFTYKYLKVTPVDTFSEGLVLGLLWMLMSLVLDFPVFSYSPLQMPILTYWKEIGFTYLLIPIITSGFALLAPKHPEK